MHASKILLSEILLGFVVLVLLGGCSSQKAPELIQNIEEENNTIPDPFLESHQNNTNATPTVELNLTPPNTEVTFETISRYDLRPHNDRKNYVITDQASWEALLDIINPSWRNSTNLRTIDFEEEMIIAVFMGRQSSSGYDIEIISIDENTTTFNVFVTETFPNPRHTVADVITYPAHLVVTKKTTKEVLFTHIRKYTPYIRDERLKQQGLEKISFESVIVGCSPKLPNSAKVVVETQEEYEHLIEEYFDCPEDFPKVDFNGYALLGQYTQGSGCTQEYDNQVYDDQKHNQRMYITSVRESGSCEPWVRKFHLILVPAIPDNYTVTFFSEEHIPQKKLNYLESPIKTIKYGTSFGECRGYCKRELTIMPPPEITKITYSKYNTNYSLPDINDTDPFTTQQWIELLKVVDLEAFYALPERIGCPDCLDGGAEWIEIVEENESKRVTFEYGSSVPEIYTFLTTLRGMRDNFENK
ncbi:protease complex subunit PrcB family protein [Candidatus Woesearchaeota archaeon]|nr:protease complex subunit PrcB family protein [Candidatus Woesearchaeota archaeon]